MLLIPGSFPASLICTSLCRHLSQDASSRKFTIANPPCSCRPAFTQEKKAIWIVQEWKGLFSIWKLRKVEAMTLRNEKDSFKKLTQAGQEKQGLRKVVSNSAKNMAAFLNSWIVSFFPSPLLGRCTKLYDRCDPQATSRIWKILCWE